MMMEEIVAREHWHAQSLSIIVFGASGDLAKKKTYPALFELFKDSLLSRHTIICGYARSKKSDDELRSQIKPFIRKYSQSKSLIDEFLNICVYRQGQYNSASDVKKTSVELEKMHGTPRNGAENRLFYLALPPGAFAEVAKNVKASALSKTGFNRVILEKPFGHDTESARKLTNEIESVFPESSLYRIDHYLGKEIVQNLLTMRFGNAFLEPLWTNKNIKAVLIDFKEDFGTSGRGGYFDASGIVRDIMQNHLMQVLSLLAMEPPKQVAGKGSGDLIRDEKLRLLKAVEPWKLENSVLGQYVGNGKEPGYLDDETVPKGSLSPTFACTIMKIRNKRWDGVPFIMRAGKALNERKAEIRVQLKQPKNISKMFDIDGASNSNEIVMRLQPDPTIYITANVKTPGLSDGIIQSNLDLTYASKFPEYGNPEAYTRLLLNALRGNQAPFVRSDELLAAWEIATPLLKEIETKKIKPVAYIYGSTGPEEAYDLISKHGFSLSKKEQMAEDDKENKLK